MTDKDKEGGSGSGTGDSSNQDQGAGKNKTVKEKMDEAFAKIDQLEKQHKDDQKMISELTGQLKEANDVLEGERKAEKISFIVANSNFKMDDLLPKTTEELDGIIATLQQAKLPKVNNARLNAPYDNDAETSLEDVSVPAQRRKGRNS
jgi:hypothetical protein